MTGRADHINEQFHLCGCITAFDVIGWRSVILRACTGHSVAVVADDADPGSAPWRDVSSASPATGSSAFSAGPRGCDPVAVSTT